MTGAIGSGVVSGLGVVLGCALALAGSSQRQDAVPLTPSSLVGADSYDLYCSSCHGRDGHGDGPVAAALKTAPADLTLIACRHGGVYPLEQVREYINGERRVTAHGTADMPVWGTTLRALDPSEGRVRVRIENLAAYVGSLQAKQGGDSRCAGGR